ncbi:type II secretion system F family protein [Aeromicrobium sp. YIM 150415]|uniref:type II secretion system F family protein n=1 Tax=Aeromicrobium sp. YIM 150415 TaxID=2803912 RepID=UPI00196476C9|nr:type II secretion system F family protein [Aeromicrobium sp. YIM 150415]MBM9462874.1 type II secretion system F family protein [Aeromicrobium sp. YIM 150415]
MTLILLCGALIGLGVLLLVGRRPAFSTSAAVQLARLDADRSRSRRDAVAEKLADRQSERARRIGVRINAWMATRGYELPKGMRADLAVTGRTLETHLGMTVLAGVAGIFAPAVALSPVILLGGMDLSIPLWGALFGFVLGVVVNQFQLSSTAKERRQDFRHVLSSFLDLVSMSLAGGRGVPEALKGASELSDSWAMVLIRDTMGRARLQGMTPWAALGDLGDELGVEELRDLAAALALVAEDGAKVRESLTARAASMRQRELADAESQASAKSQSMLVAQLLLCAGFLVFLMYPALAGIVGL